MPKSLSLLVSSFVLMGILLPSVSLAVAGFYTAENGTIRVCYEGLVPCGLGKPYWKNGTIAEGRCQGEKITEGVSCQFCHFFVMINGIINFFLISVIPYLAVFMIVVGGIMFYFGGGKPELLSQGKKLLSGVVIGLFLIYGAYMIVGVFLSVLGVSDWTGLTQWASQGPFSIDCPIELP